jgi:outer membrane biogenesis lipoprotein LolB
MRIRDRFSVVTLCGAILFCVAKAQASESPYNGIPAAVPGIVQAENYDTGGQGVAYNVGTVEGTANSYRSDGIDIQTTTDTGGGYDLGWTYSGDYFKYTVNVATAGTYTVTLRVAAQNAVSDALHISNSSGTNLSGSISIPATGGYQTWSNVTAQVKLPAGQQTLTVYQDNGGWNINYLSFASAEGPFNGTAAAIPGTVQAENYDTGGQGIGYNVSSVNGSGNSYRSDGVDLETTTDTGGGYNLGWTTGGQWFRYTVNVATAGAYTVTFRVASQSGTMDAFYIANAAGTDLSGSVNVPNTGGYQDWTNVTATVTLPAGLQTLTINQDNAGWNMNFASFTASTTGEAPYGGTAAAVPGTVQAENYDTGGQSVAYNVTSMNGSANSYRSDGIDLEATSDTGGGDDLGWTASGQWFKYTVNVATAGSYTATFRVASESAIADAFHISNASGTNLTGSVAVPNTGAYQTWTNVTATVTLPAGQQTLTLNQDAGGWNLNYFSFSSGSGGGVGAGAGPVFGPYIYLGDTITDASQLSTIQSASGVKAMLLAFLTPVNNGCNLEWANVSKVLPYDILNDQADTSANDAPPYAPAGTTSIGTAVSALQAKGVTVGISSGGGGGNDPSAYCSTAAQVQALYQSLINQYHIKWLDFDIEGSQVSGQIAKRSQALAALKNANPGLTISYSLPLGTYGLNSNSSGDPNGGDDGINLLTSAQTYGLTIDVIDGLAQDFGNPGTDVGTETTQGIAALEAQVQSLGINSTIGICTLIGISDQPIEHFTLADATTVLNFAKAHSYVTLLSFWELLRDNGSCPNDTNTDYDYCDGMTQSSYQYSQLWDPF